MTSPDSTRGSIPPGDRRDNEWLRALRSSMDETLANLSITGHLRGFSDQPVAEIVQCGEPISSFTPLREHIERLNVGGSVSRRMSGPSNAILPSTNVSTSGPLATRPTMPGAKPGSMWRSSRARSCLRLVAANPRDSFLAQPVTRSAANAAPLASRVRRSISCRPSCRCIVCLLVSGNREIDDFMTVPRSRPG